MGKFTILSFVPRPSGSPANQESFIPQSVRRDYDQEVFNLGDRVTNGTQMKGKITKFDLLEEKIYVLTTWSGIGMNLDSLIKIPLLPSKFMEGDSVILCLKQGTKEAVEIYARVLAVHFYGKSTKYDLNIKLNKEQETRFYNIEESFLKDNNS